MPNLEGMPLVNIVKAEIVTEETTPVTHQFDTAKEANIEPEVSEGKEDILRSKNKILATNKLEDLVVGYNTTLTSNTMIAEVLAIIDGGSLVFDETETDKVIGYRAPAAGTPVSRTPFTLNVYTEEKDASGDTVQYVKFSFKHCKGQPVKFSLKDEEFFVPEFTLKSRAAKGESPMEIDYLDTLPA